MRSRSIASRSVPAERITDSSYVTRSAAISTMRGARARIASSVSASIAKPYFTAMRTPFSVRSGSSSKFEARTMRTSRASRSRWPPCGSSSSPSPRSHGHGVDGEVAAGQIGVDVVVEQLREVVDVLAESTTR